jgi:ATP-binding cassette subfamily B protein
VVESAASAAEAVRLLERRPQPQWPDVIICDISLPDEDGYRLLARIRALEAGRRVESTRRLPAIALSGYAEPEDRAQSRRAGFQVHLTKPVEPPELLAAVERLVGARRAH